MDIPRTDQTPRHLQPAALLLARAAGPPWLWPGKVGRLLATLWRYLKRRDIDKKLSNLKARGVIDEIPTRWQLIVGSLDMVRFWIDPAAADYYRQSGINYGFHQLLRFLDEPASVTDPVGLISTRDGIVGHVLQVVHANPHYDMQLLSMFDDGLAEMERQTELMLAGRHPRARSIGAIVEEPEYHARLLAYVQTMRQDGTAAAPVRDNVAGNPRFAELERVFGTLSGATAYFCTLPVNWLDGARHLRRVREFAGHLSASERRALLARLDARDRHS